MLSRSKTQSVTWAKSAGEGVTVMADAKQKSRPSHGDFRPVWTAFSWCRRCLSARRFNWRGRRNGATFSSCPFRPPDAGRWTPPLSCRTANACRCVSSARFQARSSAGFPENCEGPHRRGRSTRISHVCFHDQRKLKPSAGSLRRSLDPTIGHPMELWIVITIAAAFLQNMRSSLQRHLKTAWARRARPSCASASACLSRAFYLSS